MRRYVVIREPGSAWEPSRPMREQDGWNEHAAFMDGLAEDGFIVLGGPLDGAESEFLHVVDVESEDEIETRFAADPWTPSDMLRLKRVSAWEILLRRPD
jgi:uncharacterized protein YciI